MSKHNIHLGDCVAWAKEYKGEKFHALFCDSPYHLTSIVSRYGKEDSAPAKAGVYARSSKGFMGKTWDGGDVAFQVETWKAFKRIMYPGAFGMSFASSRGWHRLAVAIEDAGFIIHPSIFGWCYGSGFPKATRIDTQIDKGELIPIPKNKQTKGQRGKGETVSFAGGDLKPLTHKIIQTNQDAQIWQDYRYGLQALKPALEPIIVFQKPYQGRAIDNITETGAGALNIEGGRIGTDIVQGGNGQLGKNNIYGSMDRDENSLTENNGRWPANFYIDDKTGKILDKQSININEGQASKFFFQVSTQIDEADPVFYCAKANEDERNRGLENMPIVSGEQKTGRKSGSAGLIGNKEKGYDTNPYANGTPSRNPHPTLKPIDLCEYLATLLLPPDKYSPRRLFVPFSGVASEMIGAMRSGWDYVQGVELTKEYIPIAEARIKYWSSKPKVVPMFTQQEIKKMEQPRPKNLNMIEE